MSYLTKSAWSPPSRVIGTLSKKTLKALKHYGYAKHSPSKTVKLLSKSTPSRSLSKLFKGTKVVPVGTDKYLKQHRFIEMATHRAKSHRSAFRKQLGKNKLTALADPKYQTLVKRQAKRYGKEVIRDIKHPIKSFKRQTKMMQYHVNPVTGKTTKRSPAGKLLTGSYLFGLPAYYGVTEFTGKDVKKRPFKEKLTRSLSMTLPMVSPRVLPSMMAYQLPEIMFKKKKKKTINLSKIPVDDILKMGLK